MAIWWKKYPYFGESMCTNFPGSLSLMDFASFSNAMGNLWGNLGISHMMKYQDGNLVVEMHPYYEKSMSTNFAGFSQGFVTFCRARRNWWQNPCISHMLKYTTAWESNGKKAPILWKKYGNWFPRLCPFDVFCWIFPYHWKFTRKAIHFPCNEEYHRMRI